MRPFKQEVLTSNTADLPAKGNYIRLDDAAPDCLIEVAQSLGGEINGHRVAMKGGDAFTFKGEFERLKISHSEVSDQTVEGLVGYGELTSSRVGGNLSVNITSGENFASSADVACPDESNTEIIAATANRKEVILVNLHASNTVRIADSAAGANEGIPLAAGQMLILTTSAAVHCRNDSGAAVSIAVAEVIQ